MTNTKNVLRLKLLPLVALSGAVALMTAGCSHHTASGLSGSAVVLNSPTAPPQLKAQAQQQQQIGQAQNQAMQQAQARQQSSGQTPGQPK